MSHDADRHLPLVAFTSLAIAGSGTLAASVVDVRGTGVSPIVGWFGLALLVAGLVTSTWHLGQRARALMAVRGLLRSPISNEGAIGALTIGVGVLAVSAALGASFGPGLRIAAGVLAVVFLISIGLVYRVGGQLTWSGFSTFTPVTSGLAFGTILVDSLPPPHLVSTITLGAIALDTFVFSQRWRRIAQVCLEHAGALGPAFERRHEWLAARFLLLNALPCLSLFVWPTPLAALTAALGIVVDRLGFYGLALQYRTEVEIDRVERRMEQ